jgi:hypothetical protein
MTKPKKDRPFLEAFMANGEAAIDLVTKNDAIKAVPVIGTVFKLLKGLDDIRSRLFAAKLARFLSEPSLCSAAESRKLRRKLLNDDRGQEVGETLLMVLDKVTDMSKPLLLAKAFAAYLDQAIEQEALLMLMHAIDVSFVLDLQTFIRTRGGDIENETLWRERLASSGLLVPYVTGTLGGSDVQYGLAPLGDTLLHVIDHCEQHGAEP